MNRVETIKAIRAFLEANELNTESARVEDGLTYYFFNVSLSSINKVIDMMITVSESGDFTLSAHLDVEGEITNHSDIYRLVNWLNLENNAFIGCFAYIEEDKSITLLKSVDAYFHREIYGEEISYLAKLQIDYINEYFGIIDDVVNGADFETALMSFAAGRDRF